MMFTTNVRFGGQLSAAPSTVFDQSLARISADIFDVVGMSGTDCWFIVRPNAGYAKLELSIYDKAHKMY